LGVYGEIISLHLQKPNLDEKHGDGGDTAAIETDPGVRRGKGPAISQRLGRTGGWKRAWRKKVWSFGQDYHTSDQKELAHRLMGGEDQDSLTKGQE